MQLDLIFRQFGYGGECVHLNAIYPIQDEKRSGFNIIKTLQNKRLLDNENSIVYDIYATKPYNQYLEVFSETLTKFICASLKGCEIKSNPIELIKNTPKEFQEILKKVCIFTQ